MSYMDTPKNAANRGSTIIPTMMRPQSAQTSLQEGC